MEESEKRRAYACLFIITPRGTEKFDTVGESPSLFSMLSRATGIAGTLLDTTKAINKGSLILVNTCPMDFPVENFRVRYPLWETVLEQYPI